MSSRRRTADANYNFSYGERYSHSAYAANELHKSQSMPGIYAWFLRISPGLQSDPRTNRSLANIFSHRELDISAYGNLKEHYEGSIYRSTPPVPDDQSHFTRSALVAFGSPLYIGISNNVKRRLLEHIEELDYRLRTHHSQGDPTESGAATSPTADGRDESRLFAHRMAAILRTVDLETIDPLFVKVVYQDCDDAQARKNAETLLNRLLAPSAGRR